MSDPIDTPLTPGYYLAYAPGHRPGIVELVHLPSQEQHWRGVDDDRVFHSPQAQGFTVIPVADILANQDRADKAEAKAKRLATALTALAVEHEYQANIYGGWGQRYRSDYHTAQAKLARIALDEGGTV